MKWLTAIIEGITRAILGWGQEQAEKPKTTRNAETPETVRDELGGALDDFMRDKDNRSGGQLEGLGPDQPASKGPSPDVSGKRPMGGG